jgi:hypothetical protein
VNLGVGGALDLPVVLDFVDSGHDLILAVDTSTSDLIRDIAVECRVDFDEVRKIWNFFLALNRIYKIHS